MPRPRRRRLLIAAGTLVAAATVPGWRADLAPVAHAEVLAAARSAASGSVVGVRLDEVGGGGTWHVQYVASRIAPALRSVGLRRLLTRLVPPSYAAYLPSGADRAEGYYRVEPSVHWPWWRPGGGLPLGDPLADAR